MVEGTSLGVCARLHAMAPGLLGGESTEGWRLGGPGAYTKSSVPPREPARSQAALHERSRSEEGILRFLVRVMGGLEGCA